MISTTIAAAAASTAEPTSPLIVSLSFPLSLSLSPPPSLLSPFRSLNFYYC